MKAQAKSKCQTGLGLAFPSSKKSYKRGPKSKKEKRKKRRQIKKKKKPEKKGRCYFCRVPYSAVFFQSFPVPPFAELLWAQLQGRPESTCTGHYCWAGSVWLPAMCGCCCIVWASWQAPKGASCLHCHICLKFWHISAWEIWFAVS